MMKTVFVIGSFIAVWALSILCTDTGEEEDE